MKKVTLSGDVVDNDSAWLYDWFGIDCISPGKISAALAEAEGDEVELDISSNGGDVLAASEIYTAIRAYPGKVSGNVVSIAASAASVIACACEPLRISPTAHIMIHNAWVSTSGNAEDLKADAEMLNSVDESIVNAYEIKTGLDRGKLAKLMAKDTWLNAQTAVAEGFADEIMFSEEPVTVLNAAQPLIPKNAVNKLKNLILKAEAPQEETLLQKKLKALNGGKNE